MYFYSAGMHSKVTVKTFMLQKISISIFFFKSEKCITFSYITKWVCHFRKFAFFRY